MKGIVFDIQRASMNDGPGIRTTVFLKGCPLRCQWCHNPESWSSAPQTVVTAGGGQKTYGAEMSVEEVMAEVEKDRDYYEMSGGGLTVSGGEPSVQFAFCIALLREAKRRSIHTCLDTSGYFPPSKLAAFLPLVDLYHYDYKATGEGEHLRLTGVGAMPVLENLRALCDAGRPVILRCPLIQGVNDTPEHLVAIAGWSQNPSIFYVDVLPYHTSGNHKWGEVGESLFLSRLKGADAEQIQAWTDSFLAAGCKNLHISGQRVEKSVSA